MYIHSEVQILVDAIHSGEVTIEEGQLEFERAIAEVRTEAENCESDLIVTQEGIKAMKSARDELQDKHNELSKTVSDARSEAGAAYRDGNESEETSAQTYADYVEDQLEEVDAQLNDLNSEIDNMHQLEYDQKQNLDAARTLLSEVESDKIEFDRWCEEERVQIARMEKEKSHTESK